MPEVVSWSPTILREDTMKRSIMVDEIKKLIDYMGTAHGSKLLANELLRSIEHNGMLPPIVKGIQTIHIPTSDGPPTEHIIANNQFKWETE